MLSRSLREERIADGKGEDPDMSDVLNGIQKKARDNARTPMQVNAMLLLC